MTPSNDASNKGSSKVINVKTQKDFLSDKKDSCEKNENKRNSSEKKELKDSKDKKAHSSEIRDKG